MVVFDKLYRTAQSTQVHRTESLSVMGHAQSVAVSSQGKGLVQTQRNFLCYLLHFYH